MIGSVVVRLLAARGVHVRAHLGPPGAAVLAAPPGVATTAADITDLAAVAALVDGVDAVVHLAGPPSVAASFAAPVDYARIHVVGTATVLQACRSTGVRRLVYVSSAEVYGSPAANPVAEDAPQAPRSPYGAAKLGAEALVRTYCPSAGIEAVVLRPFSVYGPHSPAASLVGSLLRQVSGPGPLSVVTLRPVRDYVHVDDVAAAVARALSATGDGLGVYNVGSGTGTSVAALAREVLRAAARQLPVIAAAEPQRPPGSDVDELVADRWAAERQLGWTPSVSLADGLSAALRALPSRS